MEGVFTDGLLHLVFLSDHDRETFIQTLGEVCEKTGWIIHAYVLMLNHYHWLLETPEANLVDGMRWFQSTYSKRFNSGEHLREHGEKTAGELINKALKILGIKESDLLGMKKNDPCKQVITWLVKSKTTVKNQWIADRLCMGHRVNVTKALSMVKDGKNRELKKLHKKVNQILKS